LVAAAEVVMGEVQCDGCTMMWDQFHEMVQRAFPKKGETLSIDFEEPL
jgi:hypothetical protein